MFVAPSSFGLQKQPSRQPSRQHQPEVTGRKQSASHVAQYLGIIIVGIEKPFHYACSRASPAVPKLPVTARAREPSSDKFDRG